MPGTSIPDAWPRIDSFGASKNTFKSHPFWKNTLSEAMKKYRHGIMVSSVKSANVGVDILSAGILLQNAGLQDVLMIILLHGLKTDRNPIPKLLTEL